MDLKEGVIYIIRYRFDKSRVFTGTFKRFTKKNWNDKLNAEFENVTCYYKRGFSPEVVFWHYVDYDYYDVHKINNAKKARDNMETRALNQVLKRLVNEHFEW